MEAMSVPLCEFRQKRAGQNAGEVNLAELICFAAGGEHLAWVGGSQEKLIAACASCPIPEVMKSDPAVCYFLRPLRLIREDQSYFPCRVCRGILRKRYPRDMSVCSTCQFWFPRPPFEKIRDMEQDTQRLLAKVSHYLQRKRELAKILENGDTHSIHKFFAYFGLFLEQF